MTQAPGPATDDQLKEYHIQVREEES